MEQPPEFPAKDKIEAAPPTPLFTEQAVRVAQPVIPLSVRDGDAELPYSSPPALAQKTVPHRSWLLRLILISAVAGGAVGGGASWYFHLRHRRASGPAIAQPAEMAASTEIPQPSPTAISMDTGGAHFSRAEAPIPDHTNDGSEEPESARTAAAVNSASSTERIQSVKKNPATQRGTSAAESPHPWPSEEQPHILNRGRNGERRAAPQSQLSQVQTTASERSETADHAPHRRTAPVERRVGRSVSSEGKPARARPRHGDDQEATSTDRLRALFEGHQP